MANWLVYWKLFGEEGEPWPVTGWRIKKGSRLADVKKGDRLWLIASGENCKAILPKAEPGAGYLAEVFTVERVTEDDDGWYHYLIEGKSAECLKIKPPLDVDSDLKALSEKPDKHVGMRCQTQRRLEPLTVDAIMNSLKKSHFRQYQILSHA